MRVNRQERPQGAGRADRGRQTSSPLLDKYLNTVNIPTGHYALFVPSLAALHREITGYLTSAVPVSGLPHHGLLLHGSPGSGKTEFVQNLASQLAQAGKPVNLYYIPETFFGDQPCQQLEALFMAAEEKARSTGKRSVILWENPEVFMAHKFRTVSKSHKISSGETYSSSITERTVAPSQPEAIRMTSMLERTLAGGRPLVDTYLICTTNHFEAFDPALLRPGRLKPYKFPELFNYRYEDGEKDVVISASIVNLFPLLAAQIRRIAGYDSEAPVDKIIEGLREVEQEFQDQLRKEAVRRGGLERFKDQYRYDEIRTSLKSRNIHLPESGKWASAYVRPAFVYALAAKLFEVIPPQLKASWATDHTHALLSTVLCSFAGFRAIRITERKLKEGISDKGIHLPHDYDNVLLGWTTDPLGFSLTDYSEEFSSIFNWL